jgi:CRP/FNR family transcriptional regulator, cyclic AMP receptor protein
MLFRVTGAPIELLKSVPLFAELNDKELGKIAGLMKERPVTAGRAIVEEGKGGVGFFVIQAGTANVSVGGNVVRTLGPGDHFGEIALIADTPRTATITADTELQCFGITAWHFRPLVESNPTLAWKMLVGLARQMTSQQ